MFSTRLLKAAMLTAIALLPACGAFSGNDRAYMNAQLLPPLNMPPGVSGPPPNQETSIPSIPAKDHAEQQSRSSPNIAAPPVLALESDDIQVERDGELRWLVIQESPEEVWTQARDFWIKNGFSLAYEDAKQGIMDTDWRPLKAAPGGGHTSAAAVHDEGTLRAKDTFRVRLEHFADEGGTELFLSERSIGQAPGGGGNRWVALPADPAREAEMLQKLVNYLTGSRDKVQKLFEVRPRQSFARRIERNDHGPALIVDKSSEMAWRHVGQAIDRLGYTVVAHDRSSHKFVIRLAPRPEAGENKNTAVPASGRRPRGKSQEYSVNLAPEKKESATIVTISTESGGSERGAARKILDDIYGMLS